MFSIAFSCFVIILSLYGLSFSVLLCLLIASRSSLYVISAPWVPWFPGSHQLSGWQPRRPGLEHLEHSNSQNPPKHSLENAG